MSRRERRKPGNPERINKLLEPVLQELRRAGRSAGRALHEAWPDVIGPKLEPHTRLRAFKGGRLYVEVDSSALLHELSNFRAAELLARLRERVAKPRVAEIRFRLGSFGDERERSGGTAADGST